MHREIDFENDIEQALIGAGCYARFLLTKLPHTGDTRRVQVDDEVELKYYRL